MDTRPESDDLTSEIVSSPQVLVDQQAAQHTLIFHVLIDADGTTQDIDYLDRPIEQKDVAIQAAKQHHFEQPFTIAGLKLATDGCIRVVLSANPLRIESFSSWVKLDSATRH
jgi:hypothetical protein